MFFVRRDSHKRQKMSCNRLKIVCACAALAAQPLAAAPVTYDEGVDGEINFKVFAFEIGTNSIKGQMSTFTVINDQGAFISSSKDDDPFTFSIPAGAMLASVSLTASFDDTSANTSLMRLDTGLGHANYTNIVQTCFTLLGTGYSECPASTGGDIALPVATDAYIVGQGFYTVPTSMARFGGVVDYIYNFDVQAAPGTAPEPGSLALLGLGLAGLAATRSRKQ